MAAPTRSLYKLSLSLAVFVLIFSGVLRGQDASPQIVGIPDDWTHHHVVYSSPGSEEQAKAKGQLEQWRKITSDPRFQIQQVKRTLAARTAALAPEIEQWQQESESPDAFSDAKSKPKQTLKKDWSMVLGGTANATATVGTVNSTNVGTSSVVTINGVTLTASAPIAEIVYLSFSAAPGNGSTLEIGSVTYDFTTSNISGTAPASGICNVYVNATNVTNLYDAITFTGTAGSTTYRCYSGAAANPAVTSVSESGTTSIHMTAAAAGQNGISYVATGTPNINWTINTPGSNGTQSGTNFSYWSGNGYATSAQLAANIASTINANTSLNTKVWAQASGVTVTVYAQAAGTTGDYAVSKTSFGGFNWNGSVTALGGSESQTVGLNNSEWFPLTYFYSASQGECDNNAPSADYVAFNTGLAGTANQPTIVAYDNLYSGCPTTSAPVPNIYWQYNTGAGETISTSPVVSLDGTQVAFVQTNGANAQLVILKWAKNSALQALTSTSSYASSTGGCTAPCMVAITFANVNGGASNDTTSSPFYDYVNDVIYVGDTETTGGSPGRGYLHKFTNIFNTAKGSTQPVEVVSTGTNVWPALISGSNPVASPVLDYETGEVVIGPTGLTGCTNCGPNFHEVNVTTGAVTTDTHSFNNKTNTGQNDTPIVDPVAGYAYVFTPDDTGGHAAVWQYHLDNTTDFAASNTEVTIGQGTTTGNQFSGTFDNLYFLGTGATGNLYVCGRAATTQLSTIYQIPINLSTNAMSPPVAGPALTTGTTNCSAVSEYYTGSKDYIFLSVQNTAANTTQVPCGTGGGGCIISFDVTSASGWGTTKVANSATEEAGGTGGLVIDNAFSNPTGEGNVYFFPLSSGTCGGSTPTPTLDLGTGICGIQVEQSNVAQ